MKNIAIYCVNYHSYSALEEYLLSLDNANRRKEVLLTVFVGDNTDTNVQELKFVPQSFKLKVYQIGKKFRLLCYYKIYDATIFSTRI